MDYIEAGQEYKLLVTKKPIGWLVDNTMVCVFDPVSFRGYQRQIDRKHCETIVNYLLKDSFLPSAIICSNREPDIQGKLWIVDGQHRVEAFRMLREEHYERFCAIAGSEIPVVIMDDVPIEKEIETFITINKTSKKVDTSLAYVLKNKISMENGDMAMPKSEYLSVEVARKIGLEGESKIWAGKILFEGNVKLAEEYISLNAFVRATRILINLMWKKGILSFDWYNREDVETATQIATEMIDFIWTRVQMRWPELFVSQDENRRIIQGSIGYTAITRSLVKLMRDKDIHDKESFMSMTSSIIMSFRVGHDKWMNKGLYSKYSSESGYKIVSDELIGVM